MSVDGTEVDAQQPVVGADAKRVEISYTALNLSVPEAMHFRYRLDGFDNDWHHAGVQRQATYTGLGAGDYRFRVVALNHDGVASLDEATLSFSVAQVFYLNPLFFAGLRGVADRTAVVSLPRKLASLGATTTCPPGRASCRARKNCS